MELALQVVGLKMTGKLEDAKNVAMRIVGTSTPDQQQLNINGIVNMSNTLSSASLDVRRLLSRSNGDIQQLILDFLSILDSHEDDDDDSSPAPDDGSASGPHSRADVKMWSVHELTVICRQNSSIAPVLAYFQIAGTESNMVTS